MAADDTTNVKVGVDTSQLDAGSQQAVNTVEDMTKTMKDKFSDLSNSTSKDIEGMTSKITDCIGQQNSILGSFISNLQKGGEFTIFTAIVAGAVAAGAAIVGLVDKLAKYSEEVSKNSIITGLSTEETQEFMGAVEAMGVSAETAVAAMAKLDVNIGKARESAGPARDAFTACHISLEDLKNLKPEEIFNRVIDTLHNTTDAATLNQVSMALMGKSYKEVALLIKGGSGQLKAWEQDVKDSGAELDENGTKKLDAYNDVLHQSEIESKALSVQTGVVLSDSVKSCASAWDRMKEGMVESIKEGGMLNGILQVCGGICNILAKIINGISVNFATLGYVMKVATITVVGWGTAASAISHGGMKEASEAIDKMKKETKEATDAYWKYINALSSPVKAPAAPSPKAKPADSIKEHKESKTDNKQENEEKKNATELAKELEKIAEGSINEQEKDVKEMVDNDIITRQEGEKRLETLYKNEEMAKKTALNKEYEEIKKTTLDSEGAHKVYLAKWQELEQNTANKIKDIRRTLTKDDKADAETAAKEKERLAADSIKDAKETADSEIDEQRAKNAVLFAQGSLTDSEMLKADIALDNQKIASDADYFAKLKVLYANDAQEYQKVLLEELKNKRQNNLLKLADDKKMADQDNKIWKNLSQTMEQSFTSSITSMLKHEQTFTQSLKNMWNSMASFFIETIIHKMIDEWVTWSNIKMMWTKIVNAFEGTSDAEAAVTKETTVIPSNVSVAESATGAGAILAAASVAGVPYVGPVLAASAFAMMEALGQTAVAQSASGGYDIPTGVNPVTQLHQEEMVLPKELANSVRNMTAGGGGSNTSSTHVSVNALDSKSFSRYLSGNKKAIKSLGRNFAI